MAGTRDANETGHLSEDDDTAAWFSTTAIMQWVNVTDLTADAS